MLDYINVTEAEISDLTDHLIAVTVAYSKYCPSELFTPEQLKTATYDYERPVTTRDGYILLIADLLDSHAMYEIIRGEQHPRWHEYGPLTVIPDKLE